MSWFSAAGETPPTEASPAAALDEAALLLKSFTREEAELGARAPLPRLDGFVFVLFIAAQLALNWALRLIIARPLANFLLATPDRPTRAFRRMVVKFSQACLELLVYGSFALIGLVIVPSQPWFWPSKHWWIGFADGGHEVMRDDLRCYYLLYGARYVAGFVNVLLEPKRKDFVEMLLASRRDGGRAWAFPTYMDGIGWGVVMLLLDPADVPLHLAKMFKYVSDARESRDKKLAQRCTFCADRVFELFALVFLVTRIAMYPYVCWSAHVEATRYFPKGLPEWTCVALLWTLYGLQCYWFYLIIKVAVRMMATGRAEDVRSRSSRVSLSGNLPEWLFNTVTPSGPSVAVRMGVRPCSFVRHRASTHPSP